jgi:hypothetical protein
MRLRQLIPAIAASFVLVAATTALAAGVPPSTWETMITDDPAMGGALNGTWNLRFEACGRRLSCYELKHDGHLAVKGHDTFPGNSDTIEFDREDGPDKCPGTGRYRFDLRPKTLRFRVISDRNAACVKFKDVLTHGHFTKVR